jgi:PAS domain-containing protein
MDLGKRLRDWPVVRQVAAGQVLGLGRTAQSPASAGTTPRTNDADEVVQSICPYCAVGCAQNVYVKDRAGRYLVANARHEEILGVAAGGAIGHTDHELLPEPLAQLLADQDFGDPDEARTRRQEIEYVDHPARHGLGGCEASCYLVIAASYLLQRGYPVLRLNLRGAGPSRPHCRLQYHAGECQ